MRPTATAAKSKPSRRRGVTLVEMLVTVALVLLMMIVIVTIFQSAVGAMHVAQVYQDLDQVLRRLDGTIRQDLRGATARFTPPLNPKLNLGYFEYGENVNADLQGEDTDDYIALTVKAPIGQPFRGRMWVRITPANPNFAIQPVEITSDFAEVIYFLRNGNLYRRVLLVVPEKQHMISPGVATAFNFVWPLYGLPVSWIGMNDLSARPADTLSSMANMGAGGIYLPILNTLGDLTNRENRYSRPRFSNDYVNNITGAIGADGMPDDMNFNGVPDYYPTLYPNALGLLNEAGNPPPRHATLDSLAFPYIFPGMYSQPSLNVPADNSIGLMHGLDPTTNNINTLQINHSPLLLGQGDTLYPPGGLQTWWGFPTWRETMSTQWTDPVWRLNDGVNNPNATQALGLSWMNLVPLPPMTSAVIPNTITMYRLNPQPFSDGAGSSIFAALPAGQPDLLWLNTWENDLIATGVRSFDVKAFDPTVKTYADLGYGSGQNPNLFLASTPPASLFTFAHEGRMPPKSTDYRSDPQWPLFTPIGDDNVTTNRLRRVWDTWSTEYTNAPDIPLNPLAGPPFANPVYPSYPPPYPAPLRGIQIQIRLVNDPKSDRVKVLTIRQDFTDKL